MTDDGPWRTVLSTRRAELPGGVELEYTLDDVDQDPDTPRGAAHAKVVMDVGPHEIVVTRDLVAFRDAYSWGKKVAVMVRQLGADLERLRFDEGEDYDGDR